MPMTRSRALATAVSAAVLLGLTLGGAPALADDPPPLVWSPVPGYPVTVDGVTISWETASSTTSPFDSTLQLLDALPVLRADIVNNSAETVHLGLGTDFGTQGEVEHLWTPAGWGDFAEMLSSIDDTFWLTLDPGESLADADGGASTWANPLPSWSGHTLGIFELSEPPTEGIVPTATPLDLFVQPGGFVPAHTEEAELDHFSQLVGTEARVNSSGGSPDLFPGLSSTVTASGLTPGEQLELWIAPNMDYFAVVLYGGGLPVGAQQVGTGTVGPDGVLDADFTLPSDTVKQSYQLVAGNRGERYWPAGTHSSFEVTDPPNPVTVPSVPGVEAEIPLTQTTALVTYPVTSSAGTTTVVESSTGPLPDNFVMATDPPMYYHLSTTATFSDDVTVCFEYDPVALPGPAPRLYHYDIDRDPAQWVDITTSRVEGKVCGLTPSFSPFTIGYPDGFDFGGFLDPVSDGPNVAKAGQAIPVKFSLDGDQGLEVVTSARFVIEGTDLNPVGEVLDAVTASRSGLSYDAASDTYTYVWKTDKAWAKKTGKFVLTLSDDSQHEFEVSFTK